MDIFEKNKFLRRMVFLLILMNLTTVAFIIWKQSQQTSGPPPKRDIAKVSALLKEKLNLSSGQEEELRKIRESFFNQEEALALRIKSERDSMNLLMFQQYTDSAQVYTLAQKISENEFRMESLRIEQAYQLKTILDEKQLARMHELVRDIRDYFQPVKNNSKK